MIKALHQNYREIINYSIEDFEKTMSIIWSNTLTYENEKIREKISKRCKRAFNRKKIDLRQKWLGVYFSKEIDKEKTPQLLIKWINSTVGYGVVADEEIPSGAFIGEYTGIVRRRKRKNDYTNNYVFEYELGESFWKSPYIIDAKNCGNHTRFINHSNRPNLEPISIYHGEAMHVILVAKENISKGKELTYDYGEKYWLERKPPMNY